MDSNTKQSGYPKEVFFLGAGASVSGGVPTFADFRDKANKVLYNMKQERENRGRTPLFQNALNYWNENFNDYNIEEYYSAIEMDEQLNHNNSITTENLKDFIGLTIDILRKKLNTPSYKCLVEYKVAKAIITTNWDILLERSITELERTIFDKNAYINYIAIQSRDEINPKTLTPIMLSTPIMKLHGSLNWGYCSECGKIYYFNKPMYDALYSFDNVTCRTHKDIRLMPFIVPPTLSKLEKTEPNVKSPYSQLNSIWSKASEYLRSCEKIYFIGYSFPETDVQIRFFISNALRENSNLKEIIIVSNQKHGYSKVDFEERYNSILSKARSNPKLIFNYNGFEEFCTDLAK
ncbi:MAG: SIR2 family protein [Candidatus Methanoperedens sp.]|nr:SIR2 family protein [Candidatus Methanoperedens sp.]